MITLNLSSGFMQYKIATFISFDDFEEHYKINYIKKNKSPDQDKPEDQIFT